MEAELLTTFQKVAIVDKVTVIKDKASRGYQTRYVDIMFGTIGNQHNIVYLYSASSIDVNVRSEHDVIA
uniref:Uncharacterized protein n=1 Tax=Oryza nivara TaxID=4536 RepID=A0A0E0HEK1_ORYNI